MARPTPPVPPVITAVWPVKSVIVSRHGSTERLPPMFGTTLRQGDVFHHQMPGGGGWGDPLEREGQAVAHDVLNGKVTAAAARDLYGVVLRDDGSVDDAATSELRGSRSGEPAVTLRAR